SWFSSTTFRLRASTASRGSGARQPTRAKTSAAPSKRFPGASPRRAQTAPLESGSLLHFRRASTTSRRRAAAQAGLSPARGSVKLNVAPRTGLLVAGIVPPGGRTIDLAIEGPLPLPAGFVV